MKIKTKLLGFALFLGLFLVASQVQAASLYLVPDDESFSIGEVFDVDVKAETGEAYINAAQATITYPNDVLELVGVDKSGTFSFWVEEPAPGGSGAASFIGGSGSGVTGDALQIIKLQFKTIGAGTAALSLSDAVITASDGKGTNILESISGTSIAVGTKVVAAPPAPEVDKADIAEEVFVPPPVVQPKRIDRVATVATDLPAAPVVNVALYPDQEKWYSHVGEVIAFWEVPPDIVQVSTRLTQTQDTEPGEKLAELQNGSNLGSIDEGVWYVRVQFRNNIGWGELTYYKISLDTTPPIPFEIEIDNVASDDPTPQIRFETQDSLSGISRAHIIVDSSEPVVFPLTKTTAMTTALPIQAPGQHSLTVRVFDQAGNSIDSMLDFETLPIPSPTIDFISKRAAEGEGVFISGKSLPNSEITAEVTLKPGKVIYVGEAISDESGNWALSVQEPLKKGSYSVVATAVDERGAQSFPSDEAEFKIKPKVVLALGFIELGWLEILILVILVFLSLVGVAGWFYVLAQKKRTAYSTIAARDVEKMSSLLAADLQGLEKWIKDSKSTMNPRAHAESLDAIKKLKNTTANMKKYLGKEINKLK